MLREAVDRFRRQGGTIEEADDILEQSFLGFIWPKCISCRESLEYCIGGVDGKNLFHFQFYCPRGECSKYKINLEDHKLYLPEWEKEAVLEAIEKYEKENGIKLGKNVDKIIVTALCD